MAPVDSIRPFVVEDVPQVAVLHRKVFAERSVLAPSELEAYLVSIFFHSPWHDTSLPSLVYEDEAKRVAGFLGVLPRPMSMKGRVIRAAISTQFMIEPSRRGIHGVRLLKAFLSGRQDLSVTDGANDVSQKVWEGLGGTTALVYNIHWTRPLRVTRYVASLAGLLKGVAPLVAASKPVLSVLDAILARMRGSPFLQSPQPPQEELTAETLLACLPRFTSTVALRPDYDAQSMTWILDMARMKRRWGDLRKAVVRDAQGAVAGWYIYYLKPGTESEVLQIAARSDTIDRVLDHLFFHAWRQGAVAISGRLEPRFFDALARKRCVFHDRGPRMLIHSREPGLLDAIQRGDAFLTRLDGEWWMRFLGG